jgi:signal transduction histidine kinase
MMPKNQVLDPQARDGFVARLQRDGAVTDYLLRLRRADRVPIWVEVTAHAERVDEETMHVEALMRDVSERKRLEDQARDLYHQLLQAEKLAALGQTISGVAHEVNNPLATILTWAERLSQRPVDDQTRRGLETILSESERAAKIVRNLLTFARKRHTTRAMVDVNQIVRETLALRSYEQTLANISIVEALAAGLPPAFADPHQFQQVLLNLIINAEQAMLTANGRGTLVLRSWHDLDGDAVILEVNDDGPGVPEDVQPRIFDPFFTTKEVGKGTGLGLSMVYGIVTQHDGYINVYSEPGKGSTFRIYLPVTDSGKNEIKQIDFPRHKSGHETLLLVEDDKEIRASLKELLEQDGYTIIVAMDGEDGIEKFTDHREEVQLLLLDVIMPKKNGKEVYEEIRSMRPDMKAIFVSGYTADILTAKGVIQGDVNLITKPIAINTLAAKIREVLEK